MRCILEVLCVFSTVCSTLSVRRQTALSDSLGRRLSGARHLTPNPKEPLGRAISHPSQPMCKRLDSRDFGPKFGVMKPTDWEAARITFRTSGFYCQSQNRPPRSEANDSQQEHSSAGREHMASDVVGNGCLLVFADSCTRVSRRSNDYFEENGSIAVGRTGSNGARRLLPIRRCPIRRPRASTASLRD